MAQGIPMVTGALGYTGRYVAEELLKTRPLVHSLTNHPSRPNPLAPGVVLHSFNFENPSALARSLRGVDTLYNTYWVRFDRGTTSFHQAIENTKIMLEAARESDVRRFVHVSVTNADENCDLPYFRGKGKLERLVRASGLSYAIVRPALIYGPEELLLNNVAWLLRRMPVFLMPGDGKYAIQPVAATEFARMLVAAGSRDEDVVFDAVEKEALTFEEIVCLLGETIGKPRPVVHVSPRVALAATRVLGWALRDVVLTRDEYLGLKQQRLLSAATPTATGSFRAWLVSSGAPLGRSYLSELDLHFRGKTLFRGGWGSTSQP